MTLVLVCACGSRVRAPNAQPGRVGRCPNCAARLRIPDGLPEVAPGEEFEVLASIPSSLADPEIARPSEVTRTGSSAVDAGYAVVQKRGADAGRWPETRPGRTPIGSTGRAVSPNAPARAKNDAGDASRPCEPAVATWEASGLVRPPSRSESRFRDSLPYPLWDGPAITLLVFLPPVSAVLSVFSFGLRPYLTTDDEVMTMGALTMVFPMLCLLAVVFGYAGLFLGEVLESTTRGEVRHPKVPAWEFFEVVGSLVRWVAACGFGILVGAGMAWVYGSASGALSVAKPRPIDELVMAALLGLGAGFWPLPLLSVILHADLRAANPITVVGALLRALGGSIRIGLLFALAGAVTLMLADLLFYLPNFGILVTLLGIGVFWVLFWYEAIVLVRRLGLFYRRYEAALGWFPERPRWGAS